MRQAGAAPKLIAGAIDCILYSRIDLILHSAIFAKATGHVTTPVISLPETKCNGKTN